jgi:hypothetical protein
MERDPDDGTLGHLGTTIYPGRLIPELTKRADPWQKHKFTEQQSIAKDFAGNIWQQNASNLFPQGAQSAQLLKNVITQFRMIAQSNRARTRFHLRRLWWRY